MSFIESLPPIEQTEEAAEATEFKWGSSEDEGLSGHDDDDWDDDWDEDDEDGVEVIYQK